MGYGRICGTLVNHPKTRKAGNEAMGAWVRMLSWCCEYMTDGFIPEDMAIEIAGRQEVVERLVEVSLLESFNGGFIFHDYKHHNLTKAQWEEKRAQRVTAGKNSAAARSRSTTRSTDAQAVVEQSQSQSQSQSQDSPSENLSPDGDLTLFNPEPAKPPPASQVWQTYATGRRALGARVRDRPTAAQARIIATRLKDWSVEDLQLAIVAMLRNPFNLGQNDRNTVYLDLEHAIGNDAKIQRHIDNARKRQ